MSKQHEQIMQRIREQMAQGDYTGWFETLYSDASLDDIPWAKLKPNKFLMQWMGQDAALFKGNGQSLLVVGCGVGDDAEFFAGQGFDVTAFDIAPSAIATCKERFPDSTVDYQVANLLDPPDEWHQRFDVIFECYTIQALPIQLREDALRGLASLLVPDGKLLIISRLRPDDDTIPTGPPWAVSRAEFAILEAAELQNSAFNDFMDDSGMLRVQAIYTR
ncbi:MAG: class I SAM-dependent methyltransferase [Aggregatilineales bacterium]